MKIKNVRHTGIVVRDLEESLKFYSGFLGLEVWRRTTETGGFISSVVGIDDVEIEWAKLSTPNGHLVELLEYKSHPVTNQSGKPYTANRHGCSHLAFTVDGSLDDIYKELISSGYSTISPPNENEIGVKVLYCHDPDGVIVEMVEEPDQ